MSKQLRKALLIALLLSFFIGFMIASTGAFFFPDLRLATASVLCDGELEQRLPLSNRRLNLYCHPSNGARPYAVGYLPYTISTTLFYGALAFVPGLALMYWVTMRGVQRQGA